VALNLARMVQHPRWRKYRVRVNERIRPKLRFSEVFVRCTHPRAPPRDLWSVYN
jgi:hypothetical protein